MVQTAAYAARAVARTACVLRYAWNRVRKGFRQDGQARPIRKVAKDVGVSTMAHDARTASITSGNKLEIDAPLV